jgi:hypothetical protein
MMISNGKGDLCAIFYKHSLKKESRIEIQLVIYYPISYEKPEFKSRLIES